MMVYLFSEQFRYSVMVKLFPEQFRYSVMVNLFSEQFRYSVTVNLFSEQFSTVTRLTCSPTRIFLVSAPSGKEAWTNGSVRLERTPPSGPIWLLSCLIRDTTAKYCGKSLVMMRHIRFFSRSLTLSSSVEVETTE